MVALAACRSFPDSRELDRLLLDLPEIPDAEARYGGFHALVESISDPESVAEDR
jgi:hypothetical protein